MTGVQTCALPIYGRKPQIPPASPPPCPLPSPPSKDMAGRSPSPGRRWRGFPISRRRGCGRSGAAATVVVLGASCARARLGADLGPLCPDLRVVGAAGALCGGSAPALLGRRQPARPGQRPFLPRFELLVSPGQWPLRGVRGPAGDVSRSATPSQIRYCMRLGQVGFTSIRLVVV